MLACAGGRKHWKCAVGDGVWLTPPVGHWKIDIFGGRSPSQFKTKMTNFATIVVVPPRFEDPGY